MLGWLSRVELLATLWAVDCQAPMPMGFSRQDYLYGLPFPSPGDLPDPGIEPVSPILQVICIAGEFFTAEPQWIIQYLSSK